MVLGPPATQCATIKEEPVSSRFVLEADQMKDRSFVAGKPHQLEGAIRPTGDGRYRLPDGSERFLVDYGILEEETARLGGRYLEPIKTVTVQHRRCMTTWCLEKSP